MSHRIHVRADGVLYTPPRFWVASSSAGEFCKAVLELMQHRGLETWWITKVLLASPDHEHTELCGDHNMEVIARQLGIWQESRWQLVLVGHPTHKPHNSLHLAPVIVSKEFYLLVNLINKIIMFGTLKSV